MNSNLKLAALLFGFAALSARVPTASAQGSLTPPPGAPAPVMKSLDQIEPRIPISATTTPGDAQATWIISLPGSYYLTGHLNGSSPKLGIRIDAVNVTLDLNGFTLDSGGGTGVGIQSYAAGGPIHIRNGQIRFWPQGGIALTNNADFVIENVQITGVAGRGISVDGKGRIENVLVRGAVNYGISASDRSRIQINQCQVEGVTSALAGIQALQGQIKDCYVGSLSNNASLSGILAGQGSVSGCTVRDIVGTGVNPQIIGIGALQIADCLIAGVGDNLATGGANTLGVSGAQYVTGTVITNLSGWNTRGIQSSRVSDCTLTDFKYGNGNVYGIAADQVTGCSIRNTHVGISLNQFGVASRNFINNVRYGVLMNANNCTALENQISQGINAGAIGISSVTASQRIEANHVAGFTTGISANLASHLVIRNSASSNSVNYSLHANMPVVTPAALGSNPFANISD